MKCNCFLCLYERNGECEHSCVVIGEDRVCITAKIFEDEEKLKKIKKITVPRFTKYKVEPIRK